MTSTGETKILTPIRKRSMMTGWKSAFEFEQPVGKTRRKSRGSRMLETTSRLRRRSSVPKKGTFLKKTRNQEAPNLMSVVTAKPEIKNKATDVAKDREKKREQIKKRAGRITVRKKDALALKKDEWTNALNPSKKSTTGSASKRPKMKGKKPTPDGRKKSGDAASDWQKAYQDIFSPKSGKQKVVAKQDLINKNQIASPKKKKRSSVKKRTSAKKQPIPKLPSLPLDNDEEPEPRSVAEHPSPPKKPAEPVLIEPDDSPQLSRKSSMESSKKATPPKKKLSISETPAPTLDKPKNNAFDDFVDFDSEDESAEEPKVEPKEEPKEEPVEEPEEEEEPMDVEIPVQVEPPESTKAKEDSVVDYSHAGSEGSPIEMESGHPTLDSRETNKSEKSHGKKQLVLEFALPSEEGEEDDGAPGLEVPVDLESMAEISSVGSWPSIESDDSYDTRMHKMMQRWVDVDGAYDDDYETQTVYDNDVDLEDNVLDHIVLAAPDLDEAIVQFEELTGIRPTPVGPLQGLGAKTAHVGLDENRYVEILAPDDDNPGPIGEDLKRLEPGTLTPFHYAIRSSEVTRLIEGYVYDVLGWDPDHIAMVQALPDNSLRQWDLLTMYGHDVGGVAPCYVKWKDHSQHPTATIALKADLLKCTVRAPAGHDVHKLITGVGGVNVEYGKPLLECVLLTPKGRLTFSADYPTGLVFPGYEDEHLISEMPELLPGSSGESCDEDWADVGTQSESSYYTNEL